MMMHAYTLNAHVSKVVGCDDVPNPVLRMKHVPSCPFAWRMKTHRYPEETNMHQARTIHRQCLDGCPSYDRFAKGVTVIVTPAKMSVPTLLPGVEQSHAASCPGILPYDVRTLRIVAHRARVAQVAQCGLTTHRPRHNVVDFERFGTQLLLQLAVFAAELRSLGNALAQMSRDVCRWSHRHNAHYQCSTP
jgi:hypothetical protein